MRFLLYLTFSLLCYIANGQEKSDPNQPFPIESLPEDIRNFPIRAGMSPREVDKALERFEQFVDSSKDPEITRVVLRGPFTDNPWSGFYSVEFHKGVVSRVTFTLGNLSVALGYWILDGK